MRHVVLSGRHQDRCGANHRLGVEAGLRRQVRDPVTRRSRRPHPERRIHEGHARTQNPQWRYRKHVDRPGRHSGNAVANGPSHGDYRQRRNGLSNSPGPTGADIRQPDRDRLPGARKTNTRSFVRHAGPGAHWNDRRREWCGRHRASSEPR